MVFISSPHQFFQTLDTTKTFFIWSSPLKLSQMENYHFEVAVFQLSSAASRARASSSCRGRDSLQNHRVNRQIRHQTFSRVGPPPWSRSAGRRLVELCCVSLSSACNLLQNGRVNKQIRHQTFSRHLETDQLACLIEAPHTPSLCALWEHAHNVPPPPTPLRDRRELPKSTFSEAIGGFRLVDTKGPPVSRPTVPTECFLSSWQDWFA